MASREFLFYFQTLNLQGLKFKRSTFENVVGFKTCLPTLKKQKLYAD